MPEPRPVEPLTGVLLAGGGTAGHVNPLLATAAELRRRSAKTRVVALGTSTGLEADLVPAAGVELALVPRVPLPRRPSLDVVRLPGRLRAAVRAAGDAIDSAHAQVVVGFGGYVSTPAYLAARRRRIPVVVHEANARPGLANRLGARWAAGVAVSFPGTPLRGAQVLGMPLRAEVQQLVDLRLAGGEGANEARKTAAIALGLDPERRTLLVTGGSLGAARLNAAVAAVAGDLVEAGWQVLHLTGAGKSTEVSSALVAAGPGVSERYVVREYLSAMEQAYAVADLVLCRAGASTVCELAALGLPAVYVPLPIGNGEQRLNAEPVVGAGGGLLVADADLDPEWLRTELVRGMSPDRLAQMGRAAAAVGVADGAQRLVDLLESVAAAGSRRTGPGGAL